MATTSSPQVGIKRAYQPDETLPDAPAEGHNPGSPPLNSASATSAFRNVSACNRCRVRKNRCDQKLPACSACEKANTRCVGYDPITKREIPRSYVYFLEARLSYFESLLVANDIQFDPPDAYDADTTEDKAQPSESGSKASQREGLSKDSAPSSRPGTNKTEDEKLDHIVSNIGMVSVQGTSDHRYLGATSGISFARVVLAAVKSSASANTSEKAGIKPSKPFPNAASGGVSMRDTYFGLQTKPQIKEAPFPDRELGEKLVNLYFEHANPQIPTLHRVEFKEMFNHAYQVEPSQRTPRELYLLNIVFAIGAGVIWGSSDPENEDQTQKSKRVRLSSEQAPPEEYHASAIVHLSALLSSGNSELAERPGSDLEELQAVLLLAGFALLRPVAPGLWYIVGVAVRLAIDLGLHYEDGTGIDSGTGLEVRHKETMRSVNAQERGRREWVRDLRRRLWWCTYTFDRLVSTCVGRPFGITDQVITTEFPSLLEDRYITKSGFLQRQSLFEPTYKRVAYHYFRLRLLQSEILQVLQYQQAQQARQNGHHMNEYMHTKLPSPFLVQHASFKSWRKDIDQRLWEWKESAPQKDETGVAFSIQFLELNYWQAVIMLYRHSLSVPEPFVAETSPTGEVASPSSILAEDKEDEDLVFLKCAEAGQKTLKLYRQLHRLRLVNYTYLATHHLFMAGISFLYAVWHSPEVRNRLTLDDFDFTVLAATSVLGDLMKKCPPAEACRDAFERMSKATVQMCMSTPGFGFGTSEDTKRTRSGSQTTSISVGNDMDARIDRNHHAPRGIRTKRPAPRFDMNLRDLFPDDLDVNVRPSSIVPLPASNVMRRPSVPQRQNRTSVPKIAARPAIASIDPSMSSGSMGMDWSQNSTVPNSRTFQQDVSTFQQSDMSASQIKTDQNSYNPDFMSNNLPGMDFLNNLTNDEGNEQMMLSTQPSLQMSPRPVNNTSQFTSAPGGAAGESSGWMELASLTDQDVDTEWGYGSGFGVGVGMGLDFNPQHDWSDGQGGFDLFDGFFFGANDAGGNP